MILKQIDFNSPHYQQMISIRYKTLREPLGLQFTNEQLLADKHDFLLGCFNQAETNLLGCCVLGTVSNTVLQLRQMAVSTEFQGVGIGRLLMEYAETVAKEAGYSTIILHARKAVEGFYKKLGYAVVGNEFIEVTIPHISMEKIINSLP